MGDCDTLIPTSCDADIPTNDSIGTSDHAYLPQDLDYIFLIWLNLIRLAVALGSVLSTHYKVHGIKPTKGEIEASEKDIRASYRQLPEKIRKSSIIQSNIYQFSICFE
jgi:hypothetical protein